MDYRLSLRLGTPARGFALACVLLSILLPLRVNAAECSLLILGDSLSAGYGLAAGEGWVDHLATRLQKSSPPWQTINASISGDTTQNGLQRLKPALQRHRPKGVVIELGANDILRGTPPATINQNLTQLVQQAKATGAWVVLLESPVLPNYGPAYAKAVAATYKNVSTREKIALVPCFVCGIAVKPGMMQDDRLHPTARAQPEILDVVWPYLKPKLRCS